LGVLKNRSDKYAKCLREKDRITRLRTVKSQFGTQAKCTDKM